MNNIEFINEFKKWWNDNETRYNFHFICIGYNPKKKNNIKKGTFDLSDNISNKKILAKIIYESASKYIGKKYKAELFDSKSSWIIKDFKKNNELNNVKKYLKRSLGQKYRGIFTFKNLFLFLILFLKYPSKYNYQPIIISSLEREIIIFITDHETVFVVSKDEKLVNKIGKEIDMSGANVLFSKDLLKSVLIGFPLSRE